MTGMTREQADIHIQATPTKVWLSHREKKRLQNKAIYVQYILGYLTPGNLDYQPF